MKTIKDVERLCGVSRSTISRYINGKKVHEDNRIKIEKAIEELSFHRNPMAIGLRTNKTKVVGVILPSISDPFFPRLISVFQNQMHANGYQTIINSCEHNPELEIEQAQAFARMRLDGVVIASVSSEGSHIKSLMNIGIPVVLLDRLIDDFECDSVSVDNYSSSYDAISFCLKKGHKRIAYLGSKYYTDLQRFNGLKDALNNAGVEMPEDYKAWAKLTDHDSSKRFMQLLGLSDPPTLVFCSNIYHTLGVFEAMVQNNISIPKDVSIVSFDRLSSSPFYEFTKSFYPEFTSICQPHDEISFETAKLLLKRIDEGLDNYKPIRIKLATSFYYTESVADIRKE